MSHFELGPPPVAEFLKVKEAIKAMEDEAIKGLHPPVMTKSLQDGLIDLMKVKESPKPLSTEELTREAKERGIPADLVEHLLAREHDDAEVRKGFDKYLAGEFRSASGDAVWHKPKEDHA